MLVGVRQEESNSEYTVLVRLAGSLWIKKSAGMDTAPPKTNWDGGNCVASLMDVLIARRAKGNAHSQHFPASERARMHCFKVRWDLSTVPLLCGW